MATIEPKQRTITLTDAAPVRIRDIDWPIIAQSSWAQDGGERVWWLKVRQHTDGRTIVYGGHNTTLSGERTLRAGRLLAKGDDIVQAILRVAALVGAQGCEDSCISSLPAVEI